MKELDIINETFNNELRLLIEGKLPKNHVFRLGMPGSALVDSMVPNLPIELVATRLLDKSKQENHVFDLHKVKNLPKAINNPIAIFESKTQIGSKVILTELKCNKANFVVIIKVRKATNKLSINDIKSLYPKTEVNGIFGWIANKLLVWRDKEKILSFISAQSTNLIGGEKKTKDFITNIVQNFQNPTQAKKKDLGNLNNTNMITLSNYFEKTKAVDFSKIKHAKKEALIEGHKFMQEYHDLYNDDADIKQAIDNHLRILNEAISQAEKPATDISPINNTIEQLITHAEPFREVELTDENFTKEFPGGIKKGKTSEGYVETPIGLVKIDVKQIRKLEAKERVRFFGLIKPTLEAPLLIVTSKDAQGQENEAFVKTFTDGKTIFFVSFVRTNKKLVVVSNHARRESQIKKILSSGNVVYKNNRITALSGLANNPEPAYKTLIIGLNLVSINKDITKPGKSQQKNTSSKPKQGSVKKQAAKTSKEKSVKGKFKVGDRIHWMDNDGTRVADEITGIQKGSNGEIKYITRDRKGNTIVYLETDVITGIKSKVYFINKPAPEGVNSIMPEIKFIKRYVKLHGQTVSADDVLPFLRSLQKAITEKTISSQNFYADEISDIQEGLVKIINAGQKVKVEIGDHSLKNYNSIIEGKMIRPAVLILKRAISLVGKKNVKQEAKNLLNRIKSAHISRSEPLADYIKKIEKELETFINDKTATSFNPVKIDLQGLLGLMGLQGFDIPAPAFQPGQVVSSTELAFANFKTIPFAGKWKDLFGLPGDPFKMMIFGKPGCGKSSLAIDFGHYLAKEHAKSVLYVSDEERFSYTLTEKINRLNAKHPNLMFAQKLPDSLQPYDVVFIDSVNSMNLQPEDLKALFEKYPKKSFIFVFQTTKDGQFKGKQDFEHDVDAVIRCENKTAFSEKNRFGGNKTVSVF